MIFRSLGRRLFACFPQIFILSYFSLVTLSIVYAPNIYANPEGGVVAAGQAVISAPAPNTVQINQSSQNAVVNWQSYNVGHHEQVNYQQPNAQSITLNRINPANGVSQIFGAINANGRVWLINPAGIWFGPTSQVNVAGLLATTAGISNEDFMSGNYHFTQAEGWNGSVINEGYIMVTNAGLVALVGPGAVNRGEIVATFGTVVLGAGKSFTVDFAGDSLLQFDVGSDVNRTANDQYGNPLASAIENSGTIIANGGKIQMTAKVAASVLDNAINMSGVAVANSVGVQNGEIILSAGNGRATVTGTVRAVGANNGEKGGVVTILGNEVVLAGHAVIDVSGDAGGGTILAGGNARGEGSEQRAAYTFMGSQASMLADATRMGDGGKIVLWSDLGTQFYGTISARGGVEGGNGGWVETSGKEYLVALGSVVAGGVNGANGTWLLDPRNVTITNSTTNGAFDGGNPNIYTPVGDTATVNAATINASLDAGTNVEVNTGSTGVQAGNITVTSAITKSSGLTTPTLTLNAAGAIAINAAIGFSSGGLGLVLISGGAITQTAALTLTTLTANSGGAITLTNAANNFTGAVSLTTAGVNSASIRDANALNMGTSSIGGGLTITSAGALTQSGALTVAGITTIAAGATNNITLTDAGNDFGTVAITTGLNASLVDANALILGASTVTGTLDVVTNGAVTQSGALTITGITTLTAGSGNDITLTNSANNFTTVNTVSGNNVSLRDSGTIIIGATNAASSLNIIAGGAITQSGAIISPTLIAKTLGTNLAITLNNAANETDSIDLRSRNAGDTANSGGAIAYRDATGFNIANTIATTSTVTLTAGDAITQNSGAGTGIFGSTLTAKTLNNLGSAITLNNTLNALTTIDLRVRNAADTANVSADITYTDTNALVVAAANTLGNVVLNAGGAITQTGAMTGSSLVAKTLIDVGAAITLNIAAGNVFNTINLFARNLADTSNAAGAIAYRGAAGFDIAGVGTTSTLSLQNNNTITNSAMTQSGAIAAGVTTIIGGATNDVNLNNASNDFNTVAITSGFNSTLVDNNALILGTSTVSGTLGVTANGALTQSGAVVVTGATTLAAGVANDITLLTSTNNFTTVSIASGNNVGLRDTGGMVMGASSAASSLSLISTGAITQSGVITTPSLTAKTLNNAGSAITLNISGGNEVSTIDLRARNGADTSNAAGAIAYTDTSGFNIANTIATTSTVSLIAGDTITQSTGVGTGIFGTTLTAKTLNNSGAAITLTNALNNVTTVNLSVRNAGDAANVAAAIAYTDLNAVAIAAANTLSTVDLIAGGAITQTGSMTGTVLSVKTLLDLGAAITLNLAAGNEFNTINLQARNLADTANAAGAIAYRDATGFDIAGIATTSTLSLQNNNTITNSPITQSAAILAGATTVIGGATNDITLANAGNDFTSFAATSGLNVSLVDSNALILGTSAVSGALDVTTNGAITQSGALTVTGVTTLSPGSGNNITLNSANNFSTIIFPNANNVSFTDSNGVILGASTITGTLGVTAAGSITQSGVLSVAGAATLAAGAANSITLNNANNDFNSVAVSSALNVALADVNSLVLGTSTVSGTLGVNIDGALTQIGALTVTGVSTFSVGAANNITLNLANNFSTVGVSNANNVLLNDINGLILGASTISGSMGVTTAGAISQSGAVSVAGATTLASGVANSITLTNIANNFSSVGITNALNVALTDSNALALATSTISGTLGVTASGAITQLGALVVTGVTTLAAGAANSITLMNVANNFSTLGVTTALNVALTDLNALAFAASTISGTLNANTSGAISQSGALVVAGITTLDAGSANNITLNSANNFSTVVIASGNNVALTDSNALILGASTINGTLGVTTNGALTQSGVLSVVGVATLAAGAANSITLTNAGNDFNTLGVTSGLNVSLVDSNDLILNTSSISGTLGVTTNGALTQSGALTVTGLATLTAGSSNDITLQNAANNFSTVAVVSANNISLRDSGAIILGAINAATSLSVTGGGAITQAGVLTAPTINAKTLLNAGAGITLNIAAGNNASVVNLQARNLADTANAAGAIAYRSSTGFDLSGVATTSTLSLQNNNTITNSSITQTGAIVAGATTIIGGATNDVLLNNVGNDFSSVAVTSGLNVSLADVNALSLGASTISGTLDVATNGAITQSGVLTVTNVATFGAGAANNITLNSANNFNSIGFLSGNNVAFTDANSVILGASTINGTFGVTTSGAITQNAALTVTGATTLAAGAANNITLTNGGNIFGSVGVTSGLNVSLVDVGALNFTASTVSGTLNVVTDGDITQTGALTVTGLTTLNSGAANNIVLTNAANNFSGVNVVDANNISLRDTNAIVIGAMNAATSLNIISGGAVTQSGAITVPSLTVKTLGTGLAITLNTFANEVNEVDFRSRNATDTANSSGVITYRDATGFNVASSIATTGTVTLIAGGDMTQSSGVGTGIFASTLTAKTLNNSGAAIIFDNPLNSVTTLDLRARNLADTTHAAGALSFANANAVSVAAANTLSTVDLSAGGALTQTGSLTGSILTAKTLVNAGAAITLNLAAGNEFNAVNLQSRNSTDTANAAGTIAYRDATGFDIVGIQTTGSVSLQNNNTITNSPITQSGAIIANAVTVIGGATNNVILSDINNMMTSIAITSGLDVSIANSGALVLGTSTIAGSYNVLTGGAITQAGALVVAGLTTLASGASNDITLTNIANNFSAIGIVNALNVSLLDTNALNLSASTISGLLTVSVNGALTQSGILSVAGATTIAAGVANNIILNAANNFTSIGVTTGNNVSLTNTGSLVLNQSQVTGTLGVFAGGVVTQAGDLTVGGATGLTLSSVGGVLLTNSANQIANSTITNVGGGDIQLTSAASLMIGGLSQAGGGSVVLSTVGTLSVANGINVNSGNGSLSIFANDLNLNATGSLNSGSGNTIIQANNGTLGVGLTAGTMSISKSELQRITANNLTLQGASNVNLLVDGVAATDVNNIAGSVTLGSAAPNSTVTFLNNASSFNALNVLADLSITTNVPLTTTVGNLALSANTLVVNGGAITSAGSQSYNGALTLGADTTMLAGGNINFNGTVNSTGAARNLILNSGASNDIIFNADVGDVFRLGTITVNNANNITNNAQLKVNEWTQLAGGLTSFGAGGLDALGAVSVVASSITGNVIVNALSIGTATANLIGSVNGAVGQAAIDQIVLLNTITSGTHYFDGIDMNPAPIPPIPPSPPVPNGQLITPQEIFASYLSLNSTLAPELSYGVQYDESYRVNYPAGSCVELRPYLDICNQF